MRSTPPVPRRAAEVVQPCGLQWIVRPTDHLPAIKGLHRRLEVEAAAFQQDDTRRGAQKLPRHGDPRGAGTHDAQVTFDQGAVVQRPRIDVHAGRRYDAVFRANTASRRPSFRLSNQPSSQTVRSASKCRPG